MELGDEPCKEHLYIFIESEAYQFIGNLKLDCLDQLDTLTDSRLYF